jgi:polyisoprenoid-binding protein YceI
MNRRTALTWLGAALCLVAAAGQGATQAQQPLLSQNRSPARPSPGAVDLQSSRVAILVDKSGFGHQHAVVGLLRDGRVRLGAANNAGQLVFDMASFAADTAEGRSYLKLEGEINASTQKQVTANMLSKDVLDAARYPTATFEIESAAPLEQASQAGHPRYRLQGKFTLHGVTRPLAIDAEAVEEEGAIHLRGGFYLRQTEYGIKPFTKAFGAVGVADQLTVYGEIYLAK